MIFSGFVNNWIVVILQWLRKKSENHISWYYRKTTKLPYQTKPNIDVIIQVLYKLFAPQPHDDFKIKWLRDSEISKKGKSYQECNRKWLEQSRHLRPEEVAWTAPDTKCESRRRLLREVSRMWSCSKSFLVSLNLNVTPKWVRQIFEVVQTPWIQGT